MHFNKEYLAVKRVLKKNMEGGTVAYQLRLLSLLTTYVIVPEFKCPTPLPVLLPTKAHCGRQEVMDQVHGFLSFMLEIHNEL